MRSTLALVALIFLAGITTANAQISIVVAKSSPYKATKEELKEIFTGNKLAWTDGKAVQVVDQFETEAGKKFYDGFLGTPVNKVRLQWTKLVLSGQANAPVKSAGDDAVKKAVSEKPNAVGYISTSALDGTVKEIARID